MVRNGGRKSYRSIKIVLKDIEHFTLYILPQYHHVSGCCLNPSGRLFLTDVLDVRTFFIKFFFFFYPGLGNMVRFDVTDVIGLFVDLKRSLR